MSLTQQSLLATETKEERLPEVSLNSFKKTILFITFLLDISTSMKGEKITQLNWAMRQLIAKLVEMLHTTFAGIDVRVQITTFSDHAENMFSEPLNVAEVIYKDLTAGGSTNMNEAIDDWRYQLNNLDNTLGLQPVGILLTDGWPNKSPDRSIERLVKSPIGKESQRAAIAIGSDAHRPTLQKFISEGQQVYEVDSPEELAESLITATMASIGQSVGINTGDVPSVPSESADSAMNTMPTVIGGGLTPEDKQALLDAGYDPDNFLAE